MRTAILSALLLLAAALPAAAQDKAKPNTLTPKEIADGWILLFDGETTFGWHKQSGDVTVERDETLGECLRISKDGFAYLHSPFREFEISFAYLLPKPFDRPTFALFPVSQKPKTSEIDVVLLRFKEKPTSVTCRVTSETIASRLAPDQDPDERDRRLPDKPARLCFAGNVAARDVRLRPLNTKSLFNGKDLTGWKTFPGKKSVFTVEDGAIVCKNGPGDLQTEGKYANFVLQLECKSNGKHLNSGVFFRCKPNEYQNGYEAQIHNNFTADPAKEYTVDEYDPKTHELTGKKKVKSAAVDFGTGAIYRRVPARKQTAKDGEWFTMTIVAHGNHIATWANGIQQVDWYDNRPANDNPRNGCRLEAGHISIQGHDPTTDLSFRNIRIAELP